MNPDIPLLTTPRTYSTLFTKKHTRGRLGMFNLHMYQECMKSARKARKIAILAMKQHNADMRVFGLIRDSIAQTYAKRFYHDIMYGSGHMVNGS